MQPRPAGSAVAAASSAASALSSVSAAAASAPAASPASHFLTHMLSLSASQIAREAGFSHTRQSNLNIIAEVAAQYIHSIGAAAAAACNQSGRSECNAHDVLSGLSELGVEFSELRQWKELSESAPFAPCMPPFPLAQPVILVEPATLGAGVTAAAASGTTAVEPKGTALFPPRPPHIPVCLPALPPRRTWAATPDLTAGGRQALAAPGAVDVSAATRKRKVSENRKLESALVTLHQAAVKAALEQAQLQAQQDLRVQEAILADRPAAPAPAAVQQPARPKAEPTASAPNVSLAPPAAAHLQSAEASATTQAASRADGPSAMDTDDAHATSAGQAAALSATVPSTAAESAEPRS